LGTTEFVVTLPETNGHTEEPAPFTPTNPLDTIASSYKPGGSTRSLEVPEIRAFSIQHVTFSKKEGDIIISL